MTASMIPGTVVPMSLDTHWLTYAELADRLGITGESARNLVRRRGWLRKPGNDGVQRIGVPAEYLEERTVSSDEPAMVTPVIPPAEGDTEGATMAAMEAHIATLKTVMEHERQRADAERSRADMLTADVARLREQVEQETGKAASLAVDLAQARERAEREAARADEVTAEMKDLRAEGRRHVTEVERDVAQLRAMVAEMRRPAGPLIAPALLRWIGAVRAGRAA